MKTMTIPEIAQKLGHSAAIVRVVVAKLGLQLYKEGRAYSINKTDLPAIEKMIEATKRAKPPRKIRVTSQDVLNLLTQVQRDIEVLSLKVDALTPKKQDEPKPAFPPEIPANF